MQSHKTFNKIEKPLICSYNNPEMNQLYRVFTGKGEINQVMNLLHKEETLTVGIMDTGNEKDLIETMMWYNLNFNHGLHVITTRERFKSLSLDTKFTDIVYIVFDTMPSLGQRANAMSEVCSSSYFFLTRSDVDLVDFNWDELLKKITSHDRPVVLAPLVFNKNKELVPTVRIPHFNKKEIDPAGCNPATVDTETLYPFLGLGLYDKTLFRKLRGYDTEIESAFWQCLDFGTRCWLYGYSIKTVNDVAIIFYSKQFMIEDRSDAQGVDRFYTKALGVRLINGRIKPRRGYRTNHRVLVSEVKPKVGLYKTDFETLSNNWVMP